MEERLCTKCGQPIRPAKDSWKGTAQGIAHTSCPLSPELAALPLLPADTPPTAPAVPLPTYLTKAEAAALLRVHLNTISNKIKTGELPALRVKGGRNLLLDRRDVLALLEPVEVDG